MPIAKNLGTTPAFGYPGGKALIRKWLVRFFPPHGGCYLEPFAGRGNVFFLAVRHCRFQNYLLNDLRTAPFLTALTSVDIDSIPPRVPKRDGPLWLARKRSGDCLALVMEPVLCWAGGFLETSSFCGSPDGGGNIIYRLPEYRERVREAANRLRKATVTQADWRKVVRGLGPEDFVYLDPPYKGCNVGMYSDKDLDHEELVDFLQSCPARWAFSEYERPEYLAAFGSPWARYRTTSGSRDRRSGGESLLRTECLWLSHPAPPRSIEFDDWRDRPSRWARQLLAERGSLTKEETRLFARSRGIGPGWQNHPFGTLAACPDYYYDGERVWLINEAFPPE